MAVLHRPGANTIWTSSLVPVQSLELPLHVLLKIDRVGEKKDTSVWLDVRGDDTG